MTLSPSALNCLKIYSWPGNVRELQNEMKRVAVSVHREAITEEDLGEPIRSQGSKEMGPTSPHTRSLKETVEKLEKELIREALQTSQQNQLKAASALGLSRQGLIKKMKRYGIQVQKDAAEGN